MTQIDISDFLFLWGDYMSMHGFGELVVIFLIIFFVFGAGKIPRLARDIGSGIRDIKKAMNGDDSSETEETKTNKKSKKA